MTIVARKSTITADDSVAGMLLRIYLCAVAFALPFFCACPVSGTESANFPTDFLVWMFLLFAPSAPAFCASFLGGAGLLAAVCVYPAAHGDKALKHILAWSGIVVAGGIGCLATTEGDYAFNWMLHFLGAASFGLAVWWVSRHDRKLPAGLCGAVGLGALLLCAMGWYQRLGGQEEKLSEMQREHLEQFGRELSELYVQKMRQLRVCSFFSDPNLFAAHILATAPLVFLAVSRWFGGRAGKRRVAVCAAGAFLLTALAWTGSRGAALGGACGMAAFLWMLPCVQKQRLKWLAPVVVLVGIVCVAVCIRCGHVPGGAASASVRLVYYETALEMAARHPATGVGLGEFYPWYMRLKPLEAEISRDPHSFFMSCLSQCGVAGGLAVLALFVFPLAFVLKRTRWRMASGVDACSPARFDLSGAGVVCGGLAWLVHSCFQFNELVPGTVYVVAALPAVVYPMAEAADGCIRNVRAGFCVRVLAALPAVACIVLSAWRMPAEARLRDADDLVMDLEKSRVMLAQMPASNDLRQVLAGQYAEDYSRWKGEMLALTDAMPRSLAPCLTLYGALKREWLEGLKAGLGDEGIARQMLDVGERTAARVPHRAIGWSQIAYAAIALRQWQTAAEAVAHGMEWSACDGKLHVLKAVAAAGNPVYLPLVDDAAHYSVKDVAGVATVHVQPANDAQKRQLEEMFAAAVAHGGDVPHVIEASVE